MRVFLLLALCAKCISTFIIPDNGVLDAFASHDNRELTAYGSDPDVNNELVAYGSDPVFTGPPVDEVQTLNFKVTGPTDDEKLFTLSSAADDTSQRNWAFTGDGSSASTDLSSEVSSPYLIAEPGDLNLFQLGAQGLAELAALASYIAGQLGSNVLNFAMPRRAQNEDSSTSQKIHYNTKGKQACPIDVYHLRDKPFCDKGLKLIKPTVVPSSVQKATYTLIEFTRWLGAPCIPDPQYPAPVLWWCCDPDRAIRSKNKIKSYTDCWPYPLETVVVPLGGSQNNR
ncbi:hypothetical protein MMC07_005192 [Pseudocyphellaria aurata]|nr:hypothetical protein [Pseudocyphellaria aurata]